MDQMSSTPISAEDALAAMRGIPAPLILDVRKDPAFDAAVTSLPGALRRDHAAVANWADGLERRRLVIVACVHGHEVSQSVAAALAGRGFDARYLAGGIAGWAALGLPLAPKPGAGAGP